VARPDRLERLELPLADSPALAPRPRRQPQVVWPESYPASAAHFLEAVLKARDLVEVTVLSQHPARALVSRTAAARSAAALASARHGLEAAAARSGSAKAMPPSQRQAQALVSEIASPRRTVAWAQGSPVPVARPVEEVMSAMHAVAVEVAWSDALVRLAASGLVPASVSRPQEEVESARQVGSQPAAVEARWDEQGQPAALVGPGAAPRVAQPWAAEVASEQAE
jgi:hypothetical protein